MADRDWWPFTRLVITAAAMGLVANWVVGWKPRPEAIAAAFAQVLGVLSILAMISFALADFYLLLILIPLYAVATLNDWFYAAGRWACRAALGPKPTPLLAVGGLCGEILLFGGLGYLLHRLFTWLA